MRNWEDLSLLQKLAVGLGILAIGMLAPEIAMLVQFGGIEVAFAFLLFFFKPALVWLQHHYRVTQNALALAVVTLRHSASARPAVFGCQAIFCVTAFMLTGSVVFATSFFMPGLLFNNLLV
ncbi:hypothetical protein [Alteromonas confluentis]|uniref:Uncharacterized protein n=1 Tax=Alteromonas confluentis TaxID=1656094 RepID=A0A1E7Z786_9ALTE|nr:hypothetical protein [Alteromonas confluentis]OFC69398.1 hypothetical protein BFC18_18470 [Alteromonas confluentis]